MRTTRDILALAALLLAGGLAHAGPWGAAPCAPAVAGVRAMPFPVRPMLAPAVVRWQPAPPPAPRRRPLPRPQAARPADEARTQMPAGGALFGREDSAGAAPYSVQGEPATRAQLMAALREGDTRIPDDARLPRLTLIGTEGDCKRVLDDLDSAPELASWRGRLCVQSYRPGHPLVAKFGFVEAGSPSIYVQRPDGVVTGRNKDGAYPGPAYLAAALRKAEPGYDPAKDPDIKPATPPAAPVPAPNPDGKTPAPPATDPLAAWWKKLNDDAAKMPPLLWVGIAGLAVYLSRRK